MVRDIAVLSLITENTAGRVSGGHGMRKPGSMDQPRSLKLRLDCKVVSILWMDFLIGLGLVR